MQCNIQTGYQRTPTTRCAPGNGIIQPAPGKVVLYSPDTPQGTIYSPSVTIVPGSVVLIDAYNMPLDKHIYLNRLVKSNYGATTGDTCDPCAMERAYGEDGKIIFRERMTLGGSSELWSLIKRASIEESRLQLMIAVPGTYELELEDTEMLDNMEVEYMTWTMEQIPWLPMVYHAGTVVTTVGA